MVAGGGSTPRATSWPHIRRHAFPFHPIGCRGHDGCADTFSVGVVEMWALVVALVIDIALAWFISGAAYDEGRDLKTWFWIAFFFPSSRSSSSLHSLLLPTARRRNWPQRAQTGK